MRAIKDLRCLNCGALFDDVVVFNNVHPACPECCGGVLVTSWHTHTAPALETLLVFKPLKVQGVTLNSKAERDAFLEKANRRLGGQVGRIDLVPDSDAQRQQDCDELEHERITTLKANGYDQQDVTERRAEIKAKKEEAHVHAS